MFQFDTALTTLSKVTVKIGGNQGVTPTAADVLHSGAFDDAYFSVVRLQAICIHAGRM